MANSKYAKQYDDDNLQNKTGQINTVNEIATKTKQTITDNYGAQIKEAETAYDDQHRINAVQKLINERQVAESMANNGLTNSGLNRTQQTAVQLSYANQKAQLDRQRQSAIDALNREMMAYITQADTQAAADIASIENTYAQNRQSYVTSMEQADAAKAATIEAARIKAEQEAAAKLSRIGYGTLASMSYGTNGNVVYTDTSGNSVTMRAGANPYTGEPHKDVLDIDGKYDASKTFSNGYQPNNINGEKLKTYDSKTKAVPSTFPAYWRTDGKEQKIFVTPSNNKCWVWVGPNNSYVEIEWNGLKGQWVWA